MKQFIRKVSLFIAFFTFLEVASYAQNILEPGVSYVARQYVKNGNAFGISGPEYHSVEIKIYKDGSASGIYSVGLNDYDEDGSQMLKLTGSWKNTSKYDRKVIDIFLKYEDEYNYESFHIYVDEDQNAYLRDLNNSPAQLYKKSDLIAEKVKAKEEAENEKRKEEEAEEVRREKQKEIDKDFLSLMQQSRVHYDIIDLGLSVKWANVNLDATFLTEYVGVNGLSYISRAQLDNLGDDLSVNEYRFYDPEDNFLLNYEYGRNEKGDVIIVPYRDHCIDYVAGGSNHGNPYPLGAKDKESCEKALMNSLKHNSRPSLSTLQDQEEWVKTNVESVHYPTKAEWQELIDNCIVSVETNPIRNHPIYLAYYDIHYMDENQLFVKMLRLTSKINGKSIVLPFDSRTGTNYATSQFLSSDPNERTCVHVDANGLSFIEVNRYFSFLEFGRQERLYPRYVFGDINMAGLESDIQATRAKYTSSPYYLEQKQLRDEYEERHTDGMLSIGMPSITVINDGNRRCYEIKAPIIAGKITEKSEVRIAVEPDGDGDFYEVTIHDATESTPAYVMSTGIVVKDKNKKTEELIKQHSVYFISDNWQANVGGEETKNAKGYQEFIAEFHYRRSVVTESQLGDFLFNLNLKELDNTNYNIKYVKEHGFNNAYDQKTSRRLIVTPATNFEIKANNTIKYISGPAPAPRLGTPEILNIGTLKKGSYSNVEIGFDIIESDYPFQHPQTKSFNLSIKSGDEVVKTKYSGTVGNNKKYIVKKLTAGIPYTVTGYIIDQYGIKYESSETIILNSDGTVSIESGK